MVTQGSSPCHNVSCNDLVFAHTPSYDVARAWKKQEGSERQGTHQVSRQGSL